VSVGIGRMEKGEKEDGGTGYKLYVQNVRVLLLNIFQLSLFKDTVTEYRRKSQYSNPKFQINYNKQILNHKQKHFCLNSLVIGVLYLEFS